MVNPTDRLEERGLVVRRPNPADRRVNVLVVTPSGRRVRDELIDRLFEPPEAFRRLPAGEGERLRDVMLAAITGTWPPATGPQPGGGGGAP